MLTFLPSKRSLRPLRGAHNRIFPGESASDQRALHAYSDSNAPRAGAPRRSGLSLRHSLTDKLLRTALAAYAVERFHHSFGGHTFHLRDSKSPLPLLNRSAGPRAQHGLSSLEDSYDSDDPSFTAGKSFSAPCLLRSTTDPFLSTGQDRDAAAAPGIGCLFGDPVRFPV